MRLDCRNITFKYPNAEHDLFDNLSFDVTGSGFHALFGPSGVGKTSIGKIIINEIKDYSGDVHISGMEHLLYSYNLERLPDWSTIGDHIKKITPAALRNRRNDLIDTFGMENCMDMRFSQLSMGQKNRINLIRYLLQDFHMLIMDESLANVDELTREKIILKIKDMFPEAFFLYITHNVIEVSKFCRQILICRSVHKRPQILFVEGQDHKNGQTLEKDDLEHTMLEIMNAS